MPFSFGRRRRFRDFSGTLTALVLLAVVAIAASILEGGHEPVSGRARASDGDSFRLAGDRIRLLDIDAPELDQLCKDAAGNDWPCGRAARDHMAGLLSAGPVDCTPRDRDRFGRLLAHCQVGGRDLAADMVLAGLAVADGAYGGEERRARGARLGIWAGSFTSPRAWRDGRNSPNPLEWLMNSLFGPQT